MANFSDLTHTADPIDASILAFIEKTPLDYLVYLKLKSFFDRLDSLNVSNLYRTVITQVERPLLGVLLKETNNNQRVAANILGIHRNTLRRKLQDL